MSKGTSDLISYGIVLGGGFLVWNLGSAGKFGPDVQKALKDIKNTFKGIQTPAIPGVGGTTGAPVTVSPAAQAWADGIKLPGCVGQLYMDQHGGQLPPTTDALDAWGTAKNYRHSNGSWNCG